MATATATTTEPEVNAKPKAQIRWVNPTDIVVLTDENDPKYGLLADKIRANVKRDEELVSLVDSIKEDGFNSIVQLIQLEDGRLVAVTGRRRRAAAIEAGSQVLARVVPEAAISKLSAYVSMIRENEARKEDDVFNRAEKATRLRELFLDEYRPKNADGTSVEGWQPNKTQAGAVTRAVMLTFGFNPKTQSGKYSELLALNNLIEKVKSAVRAGEFTITQVLAASLHTLTPAKQDAKIEQMLEAKRKKANVTSEALRGEKNSGTGVSFSKRELLELADSKYTPAPVKSFIWLTTNELNAGQLGEEIAWLEKAQADVAQKKAAKEAEELSKKAKAEQEKAVKAAEKEAKKAEKEKQKAEKAARRAKAVKAIEAKKAKEVKAETSTVTAAVDDVLEV